MTKTLTTYNYNICYQEDATSPIYKHLKALFAKIPDDEFLKALKVYYAGRNGYTKWYELQWAAGLNHTSRWQRNKEII